jgi:hypothetical protein
VTHENPQSSYTEHRDGPEHDHSLPDATSIPETTDVEASLAPTMYDVTGMGMPPETDYVGAQVGWWNEPDVATQYPRWSGPTVNEV